MSTSPSSSASPGTTPIAWAAHMTAALGVSDIDRSIAWYRDVLGFELIYKLDDWGWAELRSPIAEVNVGIGQTETSSRAAGRRSRSALPTSTRRGRARGARREVRRRDDRGAGDGAARDLLRPRRQHVHARAAARQGPEPREGLPDDPVAQVRDRRRRRHGQRLELHAASVERSRRAACPSRAARARRAP